MPMVANDAPLARFGSSRALSSSFALASMRRQALHAARLELAHPRTGAEMSWETPLPADMRGVLDALEADLRESKGGIADEGRS
jgi:hypothetical protein